MMYEQNMICTLYKKLLRLYPQGFREQVGVSMEQTFNDLYRERHKAGSGLFGFVIWIFVDTIVGIIKENINMTPIFRKFGTVIIAVITAIAIIVSTYLTKSLNSMWIILIIWSITWPLWEWWIKEKR